MKIQWRRKFNAYKWKLKSNWFFLAPLHFTFGINRPYWLNRSEQNSCICSILIILSKCPTTQHRKTTDFTFAVVHTKPLDACVWCILLLCATCLFAIWRLHFRFNVNVNLSISPCLGVSWWWSAKSSAPALTTRHPVRSDSHTHVQRWTRRHQCICIGFHM